MHGAFIGACVMGGVAAAQEQNSRQQNSPMRSPRSWPLARSCRAQRETDWPGCCRIRRSCTSSRHPSSQAGPSSDVRKGRRGPRGAFVGAAKAMSDADRKMLGTIVKLARLGNPRAQKALSALKKSGEIMGGDVMGFRVQKFFKYATAPIWLPAAGLYKGSQKLFGSKGGGGSPRTESGSPR